MKISLAILVLLASAQMYAQRTSVSRDFPIYDNGGKPDLAVDPQRLVSQMEIVDRYFDAGSCAIDEYAVGGTGYRRLLRFDVVIMNRGDADLKVGSRSDPANPYAQWFYFANCHGHYHIRGFSVYELLNPDGTTAAKGTKQGFCFQDDFKYDGYKSNGYVCENQGITSGWGDWYYKQLPGQWVDITGVAAGEYILRVTINTDTPAGGNKIFDEGQNRYPNVIEVHVKVPDPRNKVDVVD